VKPLRRPARAIDPALVPFLDAVAGMLAAEGARLVKARRALRAAAKRLQLGKMILQPEKPK
jgi:hypothetical protein